MGGQKPKGSNVNFDYLHILKISQSSSICALCNVSKHHLGQGELNRYAPSAGFDPFQSSQECGNHYSPIYTVSDDHIIRVIILWE